MKYLITGSAGFIFSNYILYLLQHTNHDIVSIDCLDYSGSLLNVPQCKRHRLLIGNVCDYNFVKTIFKIEKPDIVIHAAANTHVDNSIVDSYPFVHTNVVGTHSMLEAALRVHTPQKFITVSSDEYYGSVETGYSKESDPARPRSPYSATKVAMDMMSQAYYETYNLPIIIVRPNNVLGPRQHIEKFIPKAIFNILNGKKIPLYGDGRNHRQWIYVKDLFWALETIISKGKTGEAYNIGAGIEKENIEVLNLILEILNAEKSFIEPVADRLGHDKRYAIDFSKLLALGWKPQYSFEEAVLHTVGWYKANGGWFYKK